MFKYGADTLTTGKALAILNKELKAGISKKSREKISASHDIVLETVKKDKAVYGINTGFGPLCDTIISKNDTTELQRKILLSHSVGVGDPIDKDLAKLMLILKMHSLAQGYSGISLAVLDRILWHIEEDVIPVVPEQGSVGASGDLAPLSHLFLPLIGEGKVMYKNKTLSSAEVLKEHGLDPLKLHPKAGLALINGTQFILAHAVMCVDKLYNCLSHADIIGSLMIEGLMGSQMPFHDALHNTRPFKGNIHVAQRISQFLKDSQIGKSHMFCGKVQDPYSLRCMPQVHGSSRNAWLHLKESVETEMNSVTDNPVIISEDLIISGGSFHGQPLALPLDYACLAAAELGSISDRRTYLSLEGKYEGTPRLLFEDSGLNSGFMILQYTSAALVSENKGLCFPSSADSIPTSLGQEDHVSMGSIGGRKALRVINNLEKILAIELLCAAQAFDFRKPLLSSEVLDDVHDTIRERVSFASEDRIFSLDIENAIELIKERELLSTVAFHCESFGEYDQLFESY
ncbi:histidine ammonia-lyase [Lutimonas zeaxanthinifaciens]|uniref:histidine ammonia-lyase n=1 Tax=Lutimonas zeaxanthinifaciens TaxID=3060215 RepID=UPI00265D0DD7|nr:histidine ammonia-lyase [Lutimonas sp. YSD2104]WKK66116.1 histidine ammonia-lyase [Lutimonas sp. YSD2104]